MITDQQGNIKPTQEHKVNRFIADLRRTLYLLQILQYNMEDMRLSELCPSFIKMDVKGIENAIKRLTSDMYCKDPLRFDVVKSDLKRDQLHDISLLIDWAHNINNVGEILAVLESLKEQAA